MKNAKLLFICALALVLSPKAHAFLDNTPHQFTLGANYGLNSQNPFGDFPVLSLNFNLTPSLVIQDTHETGLNVGYNGTTQKNTIAGTSSTTSTLNIGPYYRYNFPITDKNARTPIVAYVGPQFGLSATSVPTAKGSATSTNLSAGGQVGVNVMVSQNLAVNFHAFQWDTVFADETQLIITQSLGIRYYFQ